MMGSTFGAHDCFYKLRGSLKVDVLIIRSLFVLGLLMVGNSHINAISETFLPIS